MIPVTVVVDRVIEGRARHLEFDVEMYAVPREGEVVFGLETVTTVRVFDVWHSIKGIRVLAK